MSEKFLKVEDLVVEYRTGGKVVHAVNNVSFELERGKTLGLVGETGAGKTTIAKTILRVLPDAQAKVKSGKVILDGEDLLSLSEAAMRKVRGGQVTMVFQDPMTALNPIMKVGEQIAEVIRKHQTREDKTAREMAEDMLAMVGIPRERYGEYPHQFSGGMKQRVVIAIALACSPQLLIADEPTTALDVTIQAQILQLIKGLQKEIGTSVIFITHDLGVIAEVCDSVSVMYAGKVVEYGDARQIFYNPCHPYTWGLLGAMPNLIQEVKSELYAIPGTPPDLYAPPKGCAFAARCPYAMGACLKADPPEYTCSDG
ncbi:MAG: ABC transporter ATP-binding protein, partial [Clostridiales bacterium]|nr:ABC transporter ATP-binding protein [Clostridiales bacterium]